MKEMCHNCKHASEPFELRGHRPSTHHHCQHPKVKNDKSGWGTLKEFWYKCDKYEKSNKTKGEMKKEQNFDNPQTQQLNIADVIGCGDLREPNHLDYKVQNKYDEWVWKSPYAMNRYADEWDKWDQQEREKFKTKHGLTDEEMNYNPDEILGRGSHSHCL